MEVLQTSALPLGYVAAEPILAHSLRAVKGFLAFLPAFALLLAHPLCAVFPRIARKNRTQLLTA